MDRHVAAAPGVGSWIERRARDAPTDLAIIHGSQALTYAQLAARVRRLANGLLSLGMVPGDRLAWLGPNHPAFIESLFAVGLIGCALAPVNHRASPETVSDVLADTEPKILLLHHRFDGIRLPESVEHQLTVTEPGDDTLNYEGLLAGSTDAPVDGRVAPDDILLLPHTSGTSGPPKGVMLTHANVTWNAINVLSVADIRATDVTIAIAPFFRVGGTGVNVLPVLFMGGTVVVPEEASSEVILDDMERHGVTIGFANPDLLATLSRAPRWSTADLSSLRYVMTGGAPVPEGLIRRYLERGITLLQGYGLSEAAPVVMLLDPDSALAKVGSAGKPALLVDITIVDGQGRDMRPGQVGELWVRGPNVMAGYWRDPQATRDVLTPDGWLRTGDAARLDDDGFVFIVDRVRDGYTTGGIVVYPGAVERVLQGHPAVSDVGVVGVAQPGGDDVGVAFVVLAPGGTASAQELLAFARTHLAAPEMLSVIEFVDRLPRSSVGKLQRDRLREARSR